MPSILKRNSSERPRLKRPKFVFDADFPQGIAQQVLSVWAPSIELIPWKSVIPSVQGVSDADFIVNAWQKACQGIVTCNHYMLDVPETLAIVRQTRMTVVACHGRTNKVQFATGVLLVNLENIARNFQLDEPQIWELKEAMRAPIPFSARSSRVERNCKCSLKDYERSPQALAKALFP